LNVFAKKLALSCVAVLLAGVLAAAAPPQEAGRSAVALTDAAEPGRAILNRACQSCHDLGTVTDARHTVGEWPGVVERMRANGAELTDDEAKQVRKYLIKTYAKRP
jgi:cytochrome c2